MVCGPGLRDQGPRVLPARLLPARNSPTESSVGKARSWVLTALRRTNKVQVGDWTGSQEYDNREGRQGRQHTRR
ncbi:hypothetical protein NDU88_009161 [Pleurodeles waltl]|uniref:Uncharacterized protein n=1 Tax=Pleurodeles waltl TaxID=8319 RepID=A0AAV7RXK3_PLEWA|nr:hypothetical protein NDU88_009161 [Pleurodeles waltl]